MEDEKKIAELLEQMELNFDESGKRIFLNGEDVSAVIRTPEISALTSKVSSNPQVREVLVHKQQEIAGVRGVIMDGRDIGTVVLPQAQVKIFLTASVESRAQRRLLDLAEKGMASDLATVMADLEKRDKQDTTRKHSPLRKAADAVVIDTSEMSIDDVIKNILSIIENKGLFSHNN